MDVCKYNVRVRDQCVLYAEMFSYWFDLMWSLTVIEDKINWPRCSRKKVDRRRDRRNPNPGTILGLVPGSSRLIDNSPSENLATLPPC